MQPDRMGEVSFWYADIGMPVRRPALDGDATADVCIIGAGYTGLWAAWYLKQINPGLQILVIEKEFAGFGASGRNGGWLTGGFAWTHERYLKRSDEAGVRAMVRVMNGTVDEVIRGGRGREGSTPISAHGRVDGGGKRRARWRGCRPKWRIGGTGAKRTGCAPLVRLKPLERVRIPGALGAMVVRRRGACAARQTGARAGRGGGTRGRADL